ncbi:MAG: SEL1-like repeat protein [Gammaproteobacteria bacterium]|nr:SEL1-like repeat protein [Gammaproteobacteria bacterium]MBU1776504.1 SEL1-like repeat protein [Gammaproteobacteria bacterium]MBU1969804.1 SEL1-like repeat protein [Gammaproteobacteria bacterium]
MNYRALINEGGIVSDRLGDSSLRIVHRQKQDRKGFEKMGKLSVTLCMALLLVSGFAHASDNALISEANAALSKKDYSTAVSKFSVVAQHGNAAAQFNMGVFYINGQGVPRDEKQAYEWFGKSAAQGHARALQVLQKAAAKGNEIAKSELSKLQQPPSPQIQAPAQSPQASSATGEGASLLTEANAALAQKDYVTAFPKFLTLAQQGDAMAQYNVGALYLNGLGIQKDEKQAYDWFAKSAAQGNARAIDIMQSAAKAKEEAQAKAEAEEQAKAKAQAAADARAAAQAKAKEDKKSPSSARTGKSALSDFSLGLSGGVTGKMEGINNSPSFGLLAGYRFNSSFSMEAAYNLLYRNANADSFISATYPGTTATFDLTAISVAGQYRYGLSNNLSLLGNLGFHSSSFKVKSSGSGSTTGNSSGLVLGAKVQYDLNRNIGIRGGFDTYSQSGGMTGRITEVGVAVVSRF